MKPDEHKRKKNSQYKKKHGIPNATSDNKEGWKNNTHGESPSNRGLVPQNNPDKHDAAAVDDYDTEERTFSRRQVVSNWNRYEMHPDEEEDAVLQRGEDYMKLVSMSGTNGAQFRFKDEESWEEENGKPSTLNDFMSVNLSTISSRLQALPLFHRVDVDKHLFSESQINSMEEEAMCHECKSNSDITAKKGNSEIPLGKENLSKENKTQSQVNGENGLITTGIHCETIAQNCDINTNINERKNDSLTLKENDQCTVVKTEESKNKNSNDLVDMATDSLSHSVHKTNDTSSKIMQIQNSDSSSPHNQDIIKTGVSGTETDELEDWLDSVLDD